MLKLLDPSYHLRLARSRLSWRMGLVVFAAIVVVEGAILVPSYMRYERDRLDRLAFAARNALVVALRADPAEADRLPRLAAAFRNATPVRGAALYDANGALLARFGEPPRLAPRPEGATALRSDDGARYDVLWTPAETGLAYTLAARLDATSVASDLNAFLLRIFGLVLLISVFVSATTMIILGHRVLAPVLLIRERLAAAARAPAEADRFALPPGPPDEMGCVIADLNAMFRQIAHSFTESERRRLMLAELNHSLENRVKERTRELEESVRKKEEAFLKIRRSEERFRNIFEGTSDAILLVDVDGNRIVDANAEACRMLGYAREEIRRLSVEAVHPGEMDALRDFAAEVLGKGRGQIDTLHCRTKGGRLVPVDLSASIITLGGRPVMLVIGRDATERRRVEDTLRQAKEAAEAANRAKTEFFANMSHELRTPLNAIIGFSEVMTSALYGPLGSPRYESYAKDILDSGRHLLAIINDILDVAKAEAGQLALCEEEVDLRQVVEESLRLVEGRAENGGVALAARIADALPAVRADRRKMKQILVNLLSNAVKFTPSGGRVAVEVGLSPSGAPYIAVVDTGIGIAAEDIERVLLPFGQVESAFSRSHEGTGLGLPLTKSLVELHQGRLVLNSAPGLGTRVTVFLPLERCLVPRRSAARG